jgi:phenylalanyl-tRNA synthetase beta chain
MGIQEFPKFKIKDVPESKMLVMNVHESTAAVRPLIACAVLRNITFTKETYDDFIALQDRLHANVARQRTLVSIGTHDLDTIKGPFEYRADPPSKIEFTPLNQTQSIKGTEFMEFYEKDRHLGKYLHIIRDKPSAEKPLLPIIRDSSNEKYVLSLPPIINGEHSKITVNTRNVLIEITATDETKVAIVNNIITSMFSLYTDPKFEVEPVKIVSPHNGQSRITPDFTPTLFNARVSYLNSCTGLDYTPEQQCESLKRMCLEASPSPKSPDQLVVKVPPTRADVLHEADIMEDFAVACKQTHAS